MAIDAYADAVTEEPLELAGFVAGKVWLAWTDPARGVMRFPLWRALQIALLVAAAAGLAIGLARRRFDACRDRRDPPRRDRGQRRFIASPRRALVLLPLIAALGGAGVVWVAPSGRASGGEGWAWIGRPPRIA